MTVHDVAGSGEVSDVPSQPAQTEPAVASRRVVRVSRATVAAAYAQRNLLTSLGEPVPPAIAKIAELAPSFGPPARTSDITAR